MQARASHLAIEVVLVPVVVRFRAPVDEDREPWLLEVVPSDTRASFLSYVEEAGWASAEVAPGEEPRATAKRLVMGSAPRLFAHDRVPVPEPQPVTFLDPQNAREPLRLVYTVPGPVSAPELQRPPDGRRWVNLNGSAPDIPDPIQIRDVVRDYWRQSMEETTRGLDLLPRYFTMTQLLDAYQAVWDEELDWGNFQDWVVERNPGMVRRVKAAEVERARQLALERGLAGMTAKEVVATGAGGLVGTSLAAMAVPAAALALPVALTIAAAAGTAAYQRRSRGRPPKNWYTRCDDGEARHLKELFLPRPSWARSELPKE